jgi:hypothetical protein
MAESKVQKVARQGAVAKEAVQCTCGGTMIWSKLGTKGSKMVLVCQRCGAVATEKPTEKPA